MKITDSYDKLNMEVGVSSGCKNGVPIITLSFCTDDSAMVDLENGIYDPEDGRWEHKSMSIRQARLIIGDINEVISIALESMVGGQ